MTEKRTVEKRPRNVTGVQLPLPIKLPRALILGYVRLMAGPSPYEARSYGYGRSVEPETLWERHMVDIFVNSPEWLVTKVTGRAALGLTGQVSVPRAALHVVR